MKKGNWKWTLAGFVMLLAVSFCGIAVSAADDAITVGVTCTYGQSEARRMLELINGFRTSGTAWCWDDTNTTRVPYTGLGELTYDYGLEQSAMQRAAEIALIFSHTRPNGGSCFTAYGAGQGAMGENIAAGNRSAEATFDQWREENEPYAGQGHRRNMLSSSFKYIGIGHVTYNGYDYWVQEFGNRPTGVGAPAEADVEKTVSVEVLSSYITKKSVTPSQEAVTVTYGESADLPEAICKIFCMISEYDAGWPGYLCPIIPEGLTDIWSVSDGADRVSLDSAAGKIRAVSCGEARITAEVLGQTVTVPVTVVPKDLKDAALILEEEQYTYSGAAFTPSLAVSLDGTELKAGTDYTVSYADNVNAGTATATVTGTGNYTGTCTAAYKINPYTVSVGECAVSPIENQTYTGAQITPAVEVFLGEKMLTQGIDYTVIYENNVNAGTASSTIEGAGNYAGTIGTITYAILPADLSGCTLDPIPAQTFEGSAVEPPVAVHFGGIELKKDVDFAVSYENNAAVGTARAVVTGMGNYTGTNAGNFEIIEKQAQPEQGTSATPKPQTPGTSATPKPQTPATSKPGSQGSGLAKGTVKKDSTSTAKYKVKGSSGGVVTVEYVAPVNKKKTSVTVPDTVKISGVRCRVVSIAANAFKNNTKIQKVTIGKYVTSIGKNAFRGCTKLKTLKIGANVTAISDGAFYGCKSLTSITIPSRVTKIGKQAFYNCPKLKTITVKTTKLTQKSVGKNAFSKISGKAVIKVPGSKKRAYKKILQKCGVSKKVKIK